MAHGVWTDIVEIDPVVHDFATKYFGLPTTHTRVIEDAVPFAQRMVSAGRKWDYIVHDVFTGGAEPVELFTLEFLQDLRSILNPGGVIAIVSHHIALSFLTNHPSLSTLTGPPILFHYI